MFLITYEPQSLKQGPSGTGLGIEISQLSFQLLRDVTVYAQKHIYNYIVGHPYQKLPKVNHFQVYTFKF